MAGKLTTYVHGTHDGAPFVFGPDDDLPAWAKKAIDNPDVWDDAPSGSAAAEKPS